jgi:hypothetical protein
MSAPGSDRDPDDPKGLVREAYAIDGIGAAECRSILVDWALSLPAGADPVPAMARLLGRRADRPDHPMTRLLAEAVAAPAPPAGRRGGRAGRFRGETESPPGA